jgi:serine/threonine protein kinase/WD40 repeat protein
MTDRGQTDDVDPTGDQVLDALQAFIDHCDEAGPDAPKVAAFISDYPEKIRPALEAACRAHLARQQNLSVSTITPPPNPRGPRPPSTPGAAKEGPEVVPGFRIIRELGRGGMGIVYLAEQVGLRREVALKVLSPSLSISRTHVERFRREAASAAKLDHPLIVPLHAFGEENGTLYYAMEFVPGRDLADWIRAAGEEEDSAPPPLDTASERPFPVQVAQFVAGVADALHFAHERGVVHRDVKPGNILIARDGRPRVLDFGLAANDDDAVSITRSGELAGTPSYMSPEQARADHGSVDRRTDVFSLGVVLFELCTLSRPFTGNTLAELMSNIAHEDPPSISTLAGNIPRDLSTICAKAISKEPAERYATALELAEDLRRFLQFRPILAQPPTLVKRARRFVTRHRKLVALVSAIALATGIYMGLEAVDKARAQRVSTGLVSDGLVALRDADLLKAEGSLRDLRVLDPVGPETVQLEEAIESFRAARELREATDRAEKSEAQVLLAQSALALQRDPLLSLALVREVQPRSDTRAIQNAALLSALSEAVPFSTQSSMGPGGTHAFVPGRPTILMGAGGSVGVIDTSETPREVQQVEVRRSGSTRFAVTRDGRLWASPTRDAIVVRETDGGSVVAHVTLGPAPVQALAISSDGAYLACARGGHGPGVLQVFHSSGTEGLFEQAFEVDLDAPVLGLLFAPTDPRLMVETARGRVTIFDKNGKERLRLKGVRGVPPRHSARARWTGDGRGLIRRGEDHAIVCLPLDDQPEAATSFFGPGTRATAFDVALDGDLLAVACEDSTVRVWNHRSQAEELVAAGHDAPIDTVTLSGDGSVLVTASEDGLLLARSVESGRVIARLPQPSRLTQATLSSDGALLACSYHDKPPRIYQLRAARPVRSIAAHRNSVVAVAVDSSGHFMATAGRDGQLRLWKTESMELVWERQGRGLGAERGWLTFTDEDRTLTVAASEHVVTINVEDGELLGDVLLRAPRDSAGANRGASRGSGPRGVGDADLESKLVVVQGRGCRLTGLSKRELIEGLPMGIAKLRDLGEGRLLSVDRQRRATVFTHGEPRRVSPMENVEQIAVSANKDLMALSSSHRIELLRSDGSETPVEHRLEVYEDDRVECLEFSPKGGWLAAGCESGRVHVWDAIGGRSLVVWDAHAGPVTSMSFAPDGQICTASFDRSVKVWPVDPTEAAGSFEGRPLTMAERRRYGVLRDTHVEAVDLVDRLYGELILTRDVLEALPTSASSKEVLEAARVYALERSNPGAGELHESAIRRLMNPTSGPDDFALALGEISAAARLEPSESGHCTILGLAHYAVGDAKQALDAIAEAESLGRSPRTRLGIAVKVLALAQLGRMKSAREALASMDGGATGPRRNSPGVRRRAPESVWLERARAALQDHQEKNPQSK